MNGYMQLANLVNLNHPGHYMHWSIFTISVANLIIIAVMVVLFGLALLIPFPRSKKSRSNTERSYTQPLPVSQLSHTYPEDADMWTARARNTALRHLPPDKLLPDRQPAYVSSWVYVFGVATLAALVLALISGTILSIGGSDWWHTSSLGHFDNSVHLWSVELFMAFMVIHLWGKFWMAAWRGKRALTWITGVIAFAASVIECFTGYLSQQNFDAQWIATNGKDAINVTGLGSFFNLMNSGQMLMWHIVLIPIILIAVIGGHVLLVRVRGVSHPLPTKRPKGKEAKHLAKVSDAAAWRGPTKQYDILKEGTIAILIVLGMVLILAAVLSSPDDPPVTIATWSKIAPADFMGATASELAGTSETATYGPPYNNADGSVQKVGVSWQLLAGVHQPINAPQTFVIQPLYVFAANNPGLSSALNKYNAASSEQQLAWNNAYTDALTKVTFTKNGVPIIPNANYGPVSTIVAAELTMARSGALDADLLAQKPFYGSDYTKPLLFIEDGNYFSSKAEAQHLTGEQWGVMNETGSYPGQPWLWLYTLWYQLPGFSASGNIDLIAIYMTAIGTFLLLAIPFIPGLRDIPRYVPIHKLVWKEWNNESNRKNKEDNDKDPKG